MTGHFKYKHPLLVTAKDVLLLLSVSEKEDPTLPSVVLPTMLVTWEVLVIYEDESSDNFLYFFYFVSYFVYLSYISLSL